MSNTVSGSWRSSEQNREKFISQWSLYCTEAERERWGEEEGKGEKISSIVKSANKGNGEGKGN